MIISHSKQVCFWKIPRTGSSNIELILRLTAGLDLAQDVVAQTHFFMHSANMSTVPATLETPGARRAHITPQTAIDMELITQAQYDVYAHYCIVRDPVDKFVSAYHLGHPNKNLSITDTIETVSRPGIAYAVWRPQAEWLTLGNVTTLPFSDYENSVATICTAFGAPVPDQIPNVSRTHWLYEDFIKRQVTPNEAKEITELYAADAVLNF